MMITTYSQSLRYLESFIPQAPAYKFPGDLGLRRMKYFLSLLGDPQDAYPTVHVAGTSGKGSTSYLIANILKVGGYKAGLHVSPHLQTERERMQVNGELIPQKKFISLINILIPIIEKVSKSEFGRVTYYEVLLGLTFLYFLQEQVDIAIIETGLGGTFDGTNVIKSKIAVITPIGFDHMNILGDTLSEIAQNKAGIIKNGQIAVISVSQKKEAKKVLKEKVKEEKVPFFEEGKDFFVKTKEINDRGIVFSYKSKRFMFDNVYCSLLGIHQALNASIAIRTVEELENAGFYVSEMVIRKALGNAFFPGRIDVRKVKGRIVIFDGAHNEDKMKALMDSVKKIWPTQKIIGIVAFKDDKNISSIAKFFIDKIDRLMITKFSSYTDMGKYRGMDQEKIVSEVKKSGYAKPIEITYSVKEAINKGLEVCEKDEIILITGSLYLVGEALKILQGATFKPVREYA